jgi:hypothetical protein
MNKAVRTEELPLAEPVKAPAKPDDHIDKLYREQNAFLAKQKSPPIAEAGPDDFDWDTEECVVLREQRATAVYRNRLGEVIIRQKSPWPDEDVFVYLSPENEVAFMEGMAEQLRK